MSYLIELVVEHILVIRQRDDELHNQLSSPCHHGASSPPIGVLPADAIVLLMDANDIRSDFALAIRAGDHTVEVLDHAETVAAELQIVSAVPEAAVAEIEGLLAVEGGARVSVGDGLPLTLAMDSQLVISVDSPSR